MQILVWVPNIPHYRDTGYIERDQWLSLIISAMKVEFPEHHVGMTDSCPMVQREGKNGVLVSVRGMPASGLVADGFYLVDQAQKFVDEYEPPESAWTAFKYPTAGVPIHAPPDGLQ